MASILAEHVRPGDVVVFREITAMVTHVEPSYIHCLAETCPAGGMTSFIIEYEPLDTVEVIVGSISGEL